jgi:hypothetical protein
MQVVMLILSLIAATITLVLLIAVLGLWMKGLSSIVFPGLGVIISTPLMFGILLCTEIIMVLLAAYSVSNLEVARMIVGGGRPIE